MANKSYDVTTATLEGHEMEPDKIHTGTNAPGSGDIELRVNQSNIKQTMQVIRALKAFIRRLEDGRLAQNDGFPV